MLNFFRILEIADEFYDKISKNPHFQPYYNNPYVIICMFCQNLESIKRFE